jgi:hypothetical protein
VEDEGVEKWSGGGVERWRNGEVEGWRMEWWRSRGVKDGMVEKWKDGVMSLLF